MESKEMDGSDKEAKDSAKESPTSLPAGNAAGMVPPDWKGLQAYSPMPPHGYLASGLQPPPFMCGVQHLIPPYGTGSTAPHPYVMYPYGGLYAHPSMPPGPYPFNPYAISYPNAAAEASGNTPCSMEVNSKLPEKKEKLPIKRSKGSLGSLKACVSANGSYPKSGESGKF